ncbi:hypothetical protein [uncultured Clostridium sp.]|uniref:hypothetical protein n=1 Tax=uncultured Clostridium sp. TaxID=59620 RepID=UPI00261A98B3|nr:hypothetical protein [uncultured Clostridium sp.]
MSELLKKHQRKEFRYESNEFKLYEPTNLQKEELMDMVMENSKIKNDELVLELGLKPIRYVIRELTNIGSEIDEITDENLESLLDNGDREIQLLIREIEILLHEVAEDVLYQTTRNLRCMNDIINTMDVNGDTEKLKKKWEKFNKKYKLNIPWKELINNASKRKELENKLKESK